MEKLFKRLFGKSQAIKELQHEVDRQSVQIESLYKEMWSLKNFVIKKENTEDEINGLL